MVEEQQIQMQFWSPSWRTTMKKTVHSLNLKLGYHTF